MKLKHQPLFQSGILAERSDDTPMVHKDSQLVHVQLPGTFRLTRKASVVSDSGRAELAKYSQPIWFNPYIPYRLDRARSELNYLLRFNSRFQHTLQQSSLLSFGARGPHP